MSPTLQAGAATLDVVRGDRAPRGARFYAYGLLLGALGALVVLVAAGAQGPAPGAVLLLALPLALVVNRFVFLPNETGVTADAAVLFAAIVAFHGDATYLGPLVVALLVGLLDARHWEARAFVRMAYNSGSQAIVTLVATVVYAQFVAALGSSWPRWLIAAAVAAIPYVLVETAAGVGLVTLLGERARDAAREQLPLNLVALPLGLFGALTGIVILEVGWWTVLVMLLPVPLVPELLLVEVRRRWVGLRLAAVAVWSATVGLGAALAVVLPLPQPATLGWLVVIGAVAGAECRATRQQAVPVLGSVAVLAAVVVVPGDARFLAALVAGVTATAAATLLTRQRVGVGAPVVAVLGSGAAAAIVGVAPPGDRVTVRVLGVALLAGAACLAVTERRPSTLAWSAPLLGTGLTLAFVWTELGEWGGIVFGVGVASTVVAAGAWGAPPWRSRWVNRAASTRGARARVPVLVLTASVAIAAGVVGSRGVPLLVAASCGLACVAQVALATRQWRFAPRPRARGCALVLAAVGAVALVYVPLSSVHRAAAVGVLVAVVSWSLVTLWRLAARLQPVPTSRAQVAPEDTVDGRSDEHVS